MNCTETERRNRRLRRGGKTFGNTGQLCDNYATAYDFNSCGFKGALVSSFVWNWKDHLFTKALWISKSTGVVEDFEGSDHSDRFDLCELCRCLEARKFAKLSPEHALPLEHFTLWKTAPLGLRNLEV